MARKLHQAITDESHTYAVVETTASSGGRQYGNFVNLSTVKLASEDIGQLEASKVLGNSKIEVLESWEVDARSQGPRSRYGQTLEAMIEELPGHIQGTVVLDSGRDADLATTITTVQAEVEKKQNAQLSAAAKLAIDEASSSGVAEVSPGVYLWSQTGIVAEQREWAQEDQSKTADFTQAPYWLTEDAGAQPSPVRGADDETLLDVFRSDLEVVEVAKRHTASGPVVRPANPDVATAEEALERRRSLGRAM